MRTILLVEDDDVILEAVSEYLAESSFHVQKSSTIREAEERFRASPPDAVVTDLRLPDGSALDLIPRLQYIDESIPFVIITGHGSVELAVQAMRQGAEHFLTKPVDLKVLVNVLRKAIESRRAIRREEARERTLPSRLDPFAGSSEAIAKLSQMAARVAQTDRPVLLQGETGTGKGVLARWLHEQGPRGREPFVDINCAGLPRELLESELFGHEKGAFTGAVSAKKGLFEVGHHGTVFLDEIGDIDASNQAKLLKVVEEKSFRKLGGTEDRRVDVRFIAATHRDLRERVSEEKFRSDLYYRLSTITLRIPPLRERREDIPRLAQRIIDQSAREMGRSGLELDETAVRMLTEYSWPGNIRELKNVIERAVLFCQGNTIRGVDLAFEGVGAAQASGDNFLSMVEMERRHLRTALELEKWNVARAADRLELPRSTLYKKIKDYDLREGSEPPDPETSVPILEGGSESV